MNKYIGYKPSEKQILFYDDGYGTNKSFQAAKPFFNLKEEEKLKLKEEAISELKNLLEKYPLDPKFFAEKYLQTLKTPPLYEGNGLSKINKELKEILDSLKKSSDLALEKKRTINTQPKIVVDQYGNIVVKNDNKDPSNEEFNTVLESLSNYNQNILKDQEDMSAPDDIENVTTPTENEVPDSEYRAVASTANSYKKDSVGNNFTQDKYNGYAQLIEKEFMRRFNENKINDIVFAINNRNSHLNSLKNVSGKPYIDNDITNKFSYLYSNSLNYASTADLYISGKSFLREGSNKPEIIFSNPFNFSRRESFDINKLLSHLRFGASTIDSIITYDDKITYEVNSEIGNFKITLENISSSFSNQNLSDIEMIYEGGFSTRLVFHEKLLEIYRRFFPTKDKVDNLEQDIYPVEFKNFIIERKNNKILSFFDEISVYKKIELESLGFKVKIYNKVEDYIKEFVDFKERKYNIMTTPQNTNQMTAPSFMDTFKKNAEEAAYRTAAQQSAEVVHKIIMDTAAKKGGVNGQIVAAAMDNEISRSLVMFVLGVALPKIPHPMVQTPKMQRLAQELQIGGMNKVGNLVVGTILKEIMDYVPTLLAGLPDVEQPSPAQMTQGNFRVSGEAPVIEEDVAVPSTTQSEKRLGL